MARIFSFREEAPMSLFPPFSALTVLLRLTASPGPKISEMVLRYKGRFRPTWPLVEIPRKNDWHASQLIRPENARLMGCKDAFPIGPS